MLVLGTERGELNARQSMSTAERDSGAAWAMDAEGSAMAECDVEYAGLEIADDAEEDLPVKDMGEASCNRRRDVLGNKSAGPKHG